MDSREYREQLKQEYKEHYRAIKDMRSKLETQKKKARIVNAVNEMDSQSLMDSMQDSIDKLKLRMYEAEARLEAWLDDDSEHQQKMEEAEEFRKKQAAREMLESIRSEMKEIKKVVKIQEPTISEEPEIPIQSDALISKSVKKSIGPSKETQKDK